MSIWLHVFCLFGFLLVGNLLRGKVLCAPLLLGACGVCVFLPLSLSVALSACGPIASRLVLSAEWGSDLVRTAGVQHRERDCRETAERLSFWSTENTVQSRFLLLNVFFEVFIVECFFLYWLWSKRSCVRRPLPVLQLTRSVLTSTPLGYTRITFLKIWINLDVT